MKEIVLTHGKVALVDDEDFEWLSKWKWFARKDNANTFYAARNSERINGKHHTIRMQWYLFGKAEKPDTIDHINGNGLDNRKENLRIVCIRDNQCNRINSKNKISKYPGVSKSSRNGRWRAKIKINGKYRHLGCFGSQEMAFESYKSARNEIGFPVQV